MRRRQEARDAGGCVACLQRLDRVALQPGQGAVDFLGVHIATFATITWETFTNSRNQPKPRPIFFLDGHRCPAPTWRLWKTDTNFTNIAVKFSRNLTKDLVFCYNEAFPPPDKNEGARRAAASNIAFPTDDLEALPTNRSDPENIIGGDVSIEEELQMYDALLYPDSTISDRSAKHRVMESAFKHHISKLANDVDLEAKYAFDQQLQQRRDLDTMALEHKTRRGLAAAPGRANSSSSTSSTKEHDRINTKEKLLQDDQHDGEELRKTLTGSWDRDSGMKTLVEVRKKQKAAEQTHREGVAVALTSRDHFPMLLKLATPRPIASRQEDDFSVGFDISSICGG
ncbi:hypothetical protein PHYSODRAFT_324484 [Phytophthora sojae]|uniref:Uncharacterized protein n=1 Tax=Phytophthora sojae (strain P6497) TaxID=1094619 RepID=G4YYA4_PHYSP|nr:hypothetical protein PHYSODRAFT_324484 [Phytophthora sojae]EGZ23255.1 hypothetical protein PHYSODRAFT_324484 [Phytophthora sojae]|eukprot:XP_009518543.1 hypothetical protein PHYSODRAFT_324484 [Phytophthora sojae]